DFVPGAGVRDADQVADVWPGVGVAGAAPAGDVEPALAVHGDAGRARHADELVLFDGEAGPVGLERVAVDGVAAPLDREERAANLFREAGFIEEDRPGGRAAAVIGQRLDDLVAEVDEQRWVTVLGHWRVVGQAHVPGVAVVGVVAGEDVHEGVDGHVEDVAGAAAIDLQLSAVGAHADDAAALE